MQAVKGIYESGTIRLLEPVDLPDQQEVTVVIVPAGKVEHPALRYAGMLNDLTPEEQAGATRKIADFEAFQQDRRVRGGRLVIGMSQSRAAMRGYFGELRWSEELWVLRTLRNYNRAVLEHMISSYLMQALMVMITLAIIDDMFDTSRGSNGTFWWGK